MLNISYHQLTFVFILPRIDQQAESTLSGSSDYTILMHILDTKREDAKLFPNCFSFSTLEFELLII